MDKINVVNLLVDYFDGDKTISLIEMIGYYQYTRQARSRGLYQ